MMAFDGPHHGSEARELEITRLFDAPPALVFEAWTSEEHLKHWFCPAGFTVTDCTCEFREGGRFDICMRSPEGRDHWNRSRYTEIVRPERIAFANRVAIGDGPPLYGGEATVIFAKDGAGTRLHVRHVFTLYEPSAAWMIDAARPGWEDGLDKLEALVVKQKERKG